MEFAYVGELSKMPNNDMEHAFERLDRHLQSTQQQYSNAATKEARKELAKNIHELEQEKSYLYEHITFYSKPILYDDKFYAKTEFKDYINTLIEKYAAMSELSSSDLSDMWKIQMKLSKIQYPFEIHERIKAEIGAIDFVEKLANIARRDMFRANNCEYLFEK
jgi:hypothetical protein